MFSVRIVKVDHYIAPPVHGLDVCYSEFRNCQLTKVPVIRIFGPTPAGQKVCVHLHGTFPYIYIPYDGTEPADHYMHQFAGKLDQALASNQAGSDIGNAQWVYKIELVSGIPLYGYHAKEHQFLKIYFLNPQIIERAVELLQSGAIMNHSFQPHEAHIPYILQVFIDYNLYGMNLIKFQSVKFRRKCGANHNSTSEGILDFPDSSYLWDPENAPSAFVLDDSIRRQSTCELEVDVLNIDVLNSLDFAGSDMNPGIAAIWEDERQRRRQNNQLSQITPPCSQDRQPIISTRSELDYLEKVQRKLCLVTDSEEISILDASQVHGKSGEEARGSQSQKSAEESGLQEPSIVGFSQTSNEESISEDNDFRELLLELMENESVNSEPYGHSRSPTPNHAEKDDDENDEITMSQIILVDSLDAELDTRNAITVCDNATMPLNDGIPQVDGANDPKDQSDGSSNKPSSTKTRSSPRKICIEVKCNLNGGESDSFLPPDQRTESNLKNITNSLKGEVPESTDMASRVRGIDIAASTDGLGSEVKADCTTEKNVSEDMGLSQDQTLRPMSRLSLRSHARLQQMHVENIKLPTNLPIRKTLKQIINTKRCTADSDDSVASPPNSVPTRTTRANISAIIGHNLSGISGLELFNHVPQRRKSRLSLRKDKTDSKEVPRNARENVHHRQQEMDYSETPESNLQANSCQKTRGQRKRGGRGFRGRNFKNAVPIKGELQKCDELADNNETISTDTTDVNLARPWYRGRRGRGRNRRANHAPKLAVDVFQESEEMPEKDKLADQDLNRLNQTTHSVDDDIPPSNEETPKQLTTIESEFCDTRVARRAGRISTRGRGRKRGRGNWKRIAGDILAKEASEPEFIESQQLEEMPKLVMSTEMSNLMEPPSTPEMPLLVADLTEVPQMPPLVTDLTEPSSMPEMSLLTECHDPVAVVESNSPERSTIMDKEIPQQTPVSTDTCLTEMPQLLKASDEIEFPRSVRRVGRPRKKLLQQDVVNDTLRQVCIRGFKVKVDSGVGLEDLRKLGYECLSIRKCQSPFNASYIYETDHMPTSETNVSKEFQIDLTKEEKAEELQQPDDKTSQDVQKTPKDVHEHINETVGHDGVMEKVEEDVLTDDTEIYELPPSSKTIILKVSKVMKNNLGDLHHDAHVVASNDTTSEEWKCKLVGNFAENNTNPDDDSDESLRFTPKVRKAHAIISDSSYEEESQKSESSSAERIRNLSKSRSKWRRIVGDCSKSSETDNSWGTTSRKKRQKKHCRRRIVTCSESDDDEEKDENSLRKTRSQRRKSYCFRNKEDDFIASSSGSGSSIIEVGRRRRRQRSCRKIAYCEDSEFESQDVWNHVDQIHDTVIQMRSTKRRIGVDYAPNAYASFYDPDAIGVEGWTSTHKADHSEDFSYDKKCEMLQKWQIKPSFVHLERLNEETIEKCIRGELPFSPCVEVTGLSEAITSIDETQHLSSKPTCLTAPSSSTYSDSDVRPSSPWHASEHGTDDDSKDASLEAVSTDATSSAYVEVGNSPTADRFPSRPVDRPNEMQLEKAQLDDQQRYAVCEDVLYKLAWLSPIPEKEKIVVKPPVLNLLRTPSPTAMSQADVTLTTASSAAQVLRPGSAPKQSCISQHNNLPLHGSLPLHMQQPADPVCAVQNTRLLLRQTSLETQNRHTYLSNIPKSSLPQCNATPSRPTQERNQYSDQQLSHSAAHSYSFNPSILGSFRSSVHPSTQSVPSPVPYCSAANAQQQICSTSMPSPSHSGPSSSLNPNALHHPQLSEFRIPNTLKDRSQQLPPYSQKVTYASAQGTMQIAFNHRASPQHHYNMSATSSHSQQHYQSAVMSQSSSPQTSHFPGYSTPNSQERFQSALMPPPPYPQRSNFSNYSPQSSEAQLHTAIMPPPPSPHGPHLSRYSSTNAQGRQQSDIMPSAPSSCGPPPQLTTTNSQQRLHSAMMAQPSFLGHPCSLNPEAVQRLQHPGYMSPSSQGQIYHRGMPPISPKGPAYPQSPNMMQRPTFLGSTTSNLQFQHTSLLPASFPQMLPPTRPVADFRPQVQQHHNSFGSQQHFQGQFQFPAPQASATSNSYGGGSPTPSPVYLDYSAKQSRFMIPNATPAPQMPHAQNSTMSLSQNSATSHSQNSATFHSQNNTTSNSQNSIMPNYYMDQGTHSSVPQSNACYSQNFASVLQWRGAQGQGIPGIAIPNAPLLATMLQSKPQQPVPQPIRSVHEIRNPIKSLGIEHMRNPRLQALYDINPVFTAFHPPQNVRIVKRRGSRRSAIAKRNREMCRAGRILMPAIIFRSHGFTVKLNVCSGHSRYPPVVKLLEVKPKGKRGRPRLNKLRTKVLQSAYPYSDISKIRGRQRSHCKSNMAARKTDKKKEDCPPSKRATGPPISMPILNDSDRPLVNVFDTPTPNSAFPPARRQTARRSIGIRRGAPSTRGSFSSASPATILPPPSIRGLLLQKGARRGRGRPPVSLHGSVADRKSSMLESLKMLQNSNSFNKNSHEGTVKRGRGRPPLQRNSSPREISILESIALLTEKRPEDIAASIQSVNTEEEINLDLAPLEEIEPEWFEQPSTLFGKPLRSDKIVAMEALRLEEIDASNCHEPGLREEQDESGWQQETGESGWQEDTGKCDWKDDKGKSDCHEEKDESGWQEETGESGWQEDTGKCDWKDDKGKSDCHEEKDESGWQEETGESGWQEDTGKCGWKDDKGKSDCHEEKDESGWQEDTGESGWQEDTGKCGWKDDKGKSDCHEAEDESGWQEDTGESGWRDCNSISGLKGDKGRSDCHEEKDESGWQEDTGESGWNEDTGESGWKEGTGESGRKADTGKSDWQEDTGESGWEEKGESGWQEDKGESGWQEDKGESGWQEDKGESGWQEDKGESGWQEDKGESGWHEKNDRLGGGNERNRFTWREKRNRSGWHEKKEESSAQEKKDEPVVYDYRDPAGWLENPSTSKGQETAANLDPIRATASLSESQDNCAADKEPTKVCRIPYRFRKKTVVPAPSFEEVEMVHLKSDVLYKFKRDFKRVMGERPALADEEILTNLLGSDIQALSTTAGSSDKEKGVIEDTKDVTRDRSDGLQIPEAGQSLTTNGRDSPLWSEFFSPMLSALQFDTTLDENPLLLPMTPLKRYPKEKDGSSFLSDYYDANVQESPGKNTFNSYINLGSSPEPADPMNKYDKDSKATPSSLFDNGLDNFDNYMPETPCGHNSPDMFDSWNDDIRPTPSFSDAMDFQVGSPPELTDISESLSPRKGKGAYQLSISDSLNATNPLESAADDEMSFNSPNDGLVIVAAMAEGLSDYVNMQNHSLGSSSTTEIETSKNQVGETHPTRDDEDANREKRLVTLERDGEDIIVDKDDGLTKTDAVIGETALIFPALDCAVKILPDPKIADPSKDSCASQPDVLQSDEDCYPKNTIDSVTIFVDSSDNTDIASQKNVQEPPSSDANPDSTLTQKVIPDDLKSAVDKIHSSEDTDNEMEISDSVDCATGTPLSDENTLSKNADAELTPVDSFYIYNNSEPASLTMPKPADATKNRTIPEDLPPSLPSCAKSNLLTYFVPPPSPASIQSSMSEYNIPETRHLDVHCSDFADVPTKAVQLGGGAIVLKLQSKSVSNLKEFTGPLCSTGLSHWCQVLKIAEEAGYACSNSCIKSTVALAKPRFHQGLHLEFYPRPPSALQVQNWLKEKVAESSNCIYLDNGDCMENGKKRSDIENATAKNLPKVTVFPATEISPISDPTEHLVLSRNSVMLNHGKKKRRLSFDSDHNLSNERNDDLESSTPKHGITSGCRLKRSFSDGDSADIDSSLDLNTPGRHSPSPAGPLAKKMKWMSSTPHRSTPTRESILKTRTPIQGLLQETPGFSLRRQLFLQQMKTNVHAETSQLQGPTPKNTYGFKMSGEMLQDTKSIHIYQNITIMSMELHVQTDVDLRPNPQNNAICAIFYHVQNDIPTTGDDKLKRQERLTGMIIADSPSSTSEDPLVNDASSPSTSASPLRQNPKCNFHKHAELIEAGVVVHMVQNELSLIHEFVKVMKEHDPDILLGYEIQMLSWGYLFERCAAIGMELCSMVSRVPDDSMNIFRPPQEGVGDTFVLNIVGRIILNVWQILKSEIALYNYTFENVAYHILHKRIPLFSFRTLTLWYGQSNSLNRWRTLQHYIIRAKGNVQLLEQSNIIGKTSELARLFGIQFYEVLSRGTQFRVESMMLRQCKRRKYIAVSPSVHQRSTMRSPEYIPLVMEPVSKFYTHPVVVLDFQSLYPSIIIAYNYCFSTCLGRVEDIGQPDAFQFGCTSLKTPSSLLKKFQDHISVAPCGVAFVKSEIRKGIIPRMLEEILSSRIMVKTTMKQHKGDKALYSMLDARQLGLKLISNVTYGYTAANFSGRMPCVEIADSVVSKGRETLERAINLIHSTKRWNAKVVYGDTDSVFVLLEGRSKEQAFAVGNEIAQAVTADNPKPVKLKLEKVYLPCVLETKKRYVGNMYETPDQINPVYDAKGIETVRRDGCPAVAKILEKTIRILFKTHDVTQVKNYVQNQFHKILMGRCGLNDYIFTREYHGRNGYRQENHAPAFKIARSLLRSDCRAEPRVGERVPYVVTYGSPGAILLDLICHPHEALLNSSLRLNVQYYINNAICPALDRVLSLLGADVRQWYSSLPRSTRLPLPIENPIHDGGTILHHFVVTKCPVCEASAHCGICPNCLSNPQKSLVVLTDRIRQWERRYQQIATVCQGCTGTADQRMSCVSLDCPVFFRLSQSSRDLAQAPYLRDLQKKASLGW